MDLRDRPEDEAFRKEVRTWLVDHVVGEFAALDGRGGSGDETFGFETRLEWEHVLAADGWTCLGWPAEWGGRGASIAQQVIFNEEYVRAKAPGRVSVMGEGLIGPTILHYGTAGAEGPLPPAHRGRHRAVVPGLLGAERRERPGQRPDQGGPGRRRVGGHRPEGVDLAGPPVGLVLRGVPDRAGIAPAQGALLPPGAHGPARGRGPAHHPAHRHLRVQRGLLRRGPHRAGPTWWARWATAGGWRWPPWPSSGGWPCSATRCRSAGSSTTWWPPPGPTAGAGDPVLRQRLARAYAEL